MVFDRSFGCRPDALFLLFSAGKPFTAVLVHLLAEHDDDSVVRFARAVGFDGTRKQLVELFTAARVLGVHALEDIASAVHVLEPGVRLM